MHKLIVGIKDLNGMCQKQIHKFIDSKLQWGKIIAYKLLGNVGFCYLTVKSAPVAKGVRLVLTTVCQ